MTPLSDAMSTYQDYLEGHRTYPDNDELYEDLCKAKKEVETQLRAEWLRKATGMV